VQGLGAPTDDVTDVITDRQVIGECDKKAFEST